MNPVLRIFLAIILALGFAWSALVLYLDSKFEEWFDDDTWPGGMT